MKRATTKFYLQKSYCLCGVFVATHIGAMFCLYFIIFVFWAKVTLIVGFLINLIVVIRTYALQNSPAAIIAFWRNNNGDWFVKKRSREVEQVLLDLPIFISNYLVILNFIPAKKFLNITVPIAKDAFATRDDFRQLKVLLKTTGLFSR